MNKLNEVELYEARKRCADWLNARMDDLRRLREDNAYRLVEWAKAGLVNCDAYPQTGIIRATITDEQLKHLMNTAKTSFRAWEILRKCAAANPQDERLQPFVQRLINREKPPKQKPGRKPEIFRDYYIIGALAQLLDAGLNVPSVGELTRTEYNAAHVLANLLVQVKAPFVLSPDTICDIWAERDAIYQQAIEAATVLKRQPF